MEQITSFNNDAIQLFREGKHQQAVQILSELLSKLKVILSSSSEQSSSSSSPSLVYVAEPLPALPPTRCNFIYNKLFKVYSSSNPTTTSSSDSCHVFTACVIYNLAIIHHHMGVMSAAASKSTTDCAAAPFLQKAENLYQMCVRILEGSVGASNAILDCRTALTVHLIKAVSYNNLAQIYLERGGSECEEQAKTCLMNLHHLITLVDEARCNNQTTTNNGAGGNATANTTTATTTIGDAVIVLFSEEDYDGMIDNILLLRPPTMAAAA